MNIVAKYNFLSKFLVSNTKDTTIQLIKTKDYGTYLDYNYIGFVDNKVPKLNKAFLFKKDVNLELYNELLRNCNYNIGVHTYSSFSEEIIMEVKNKEYLKNITIKMRSL